MSSAVATFPHAERGLPVGRQLYAVLRDRVVRGELLPGTRLSEVETAARYAVSRQPVREAFIKLAEEALLDVRPQRGTFVSRIHVPSVMSAQFVREAVEADIVRLLAERPGENLAAQLRAMLAEQAEAVAREDPQRFLVLDEAFHRFLASQAGHAKSWEVLQPLKTQMDRVRHLSARAFPLPALLAQHGEVVDAIAAGSVRGADRAMRGHLRKILGDLPQIIAAQPDHFSDREQRA